MWSGQVRQCQRIHVSRVRSRTIPQPPRILGRFFLCVMQTRILPTFTQVVILLDVYSRTLHLRVRVSILLVVQCGRVRVGDQFDVLLQVYCWEVHERGVGLGVMPTLSRRKGWRRMPRLHPGKVSWEHRSEQRLPLLRCRFAL